MQGLWRTALVLAAMSTFTQAQLFFQDFSSSSSISDYVSATPNSGQFNAIGSSGSSVTVGIVGGALQYTRTGDP
ncbi:MAG: hypothetical protein KGS61_06060, partial [Verrucomicrobia bacterium]|nr:hypothetical protein [Verrucomicrobiota bacterium]